MNESSLICFTDGRVLFAADFLAKLTLTNPTSLSKVSLVILVCMRTSMVVNQVGSYFVMMNTK